jgi:hypothetical protein
MAQKLLTLRLRVQHIPIRRADYLVLAQHLLQSCLPRRQIAIPLIEAPHIPSFVNRGASEHFAEPASAAPMVGNAVPYDTFLG